MKQPNGSPVICWQVVGRIFQRRVYFWCAWGPEGYHYEQIEGHEAHDTELERIEAIALAAHKRLNPEDRS